MMGKQYQSSDLVKVFDVNYLQKISDDKRPVIDATNGITPSIRDIKKAYNSIKPAKVILKLWIDAVDDFYGKGQLTVSQQNELSSLIASEYQFLKLAELAIFFRDFKLGKFKQFYGAIDPQAILISLREFIKMRNEAIARYEHEKIAEAKRKDEEEAKERMSMSQFLEMHGVKTIAEYVSKYPQQKSNNNER